MKFKFDPLQIFAQEGAAEAAAPETAVEQVAAEPVGVEQPVAAEPMGVEQPVATEPMAVGDGQAVTVAGRQPATVDAVRRHFDGLLEEAAALSRRIPGFDLSKELDNPVFLRLTAPGNGISLEDAYFAVHRRQLQQAAREEGAHQTAQQISNAIQAGSMRPRENGTGGHAPAVTSLDYRNASQAQREALKKAIRAAAARGEKMYPGM